MSTEFNNVKFKRAVGTTTLPPSSPVYTTATLSRTLDNPNVYSTGLDDDFGKSVAISGNYAIVGAENEDSSSFGASGVAYIFDVATGNLLHTIQNPSPQLNANFGNKVAIDGNYAIIGCPRHDYTNSDSGAAFIVDVTTGNIIQTIQNPNAFSTELGDTFSSGIAIKGNYIAVGAPFEDETGFTSSGKTYVYKTVTGDWSDIALAYTLNNPNADGGTLSDWFGMDIAIDGNYMVVGAKLEFDVNSSSGIVYVFELSSGSLLQTIHNPNAYSTKQNDYFGEGISLSGTTLVVGTQSEDDASGASAGVTYVFDVTTGNLLHTIQNPNPYFGSAGDSFGNAVSIYGNYAVIAAREEYTSIGENSSGVVYIFDATTAELKMTIENPNAYGTPSVDRFGQSVWIDNNFLIVGASSEDDATGTSSGKAYIYELS